MNRKDRLNEKFQIDSQAFAHLRALDPDLPEHVWRVIIRYRAQVPQPQWEAVREFTIANAVRMQPRTFETVRRLMTMSARFNIWVWVTTGCDLTPERVYTQNNVYRYLQERLPKHSDVHRWGVVRQLGAIADALAETSVKRLRSPRRSGHSPFTLSDVAALHSWARSLPTDLQRQNASAILGLAGGAGLRSSEIVDITIGDIELADGRVFVNIPGPQARRVPVMHPWNRTLLRSIENRSHETEEYVFRGYRLEEYRPRAIQNFLTDHPGKVRATVSRLRGTWLVAQMENGLSVPVLMRIAGLSTTNGLNKYVAFTSEPNMADYYGLIIGEEVAR